ncbi:MAG: hypothetical protein AYK19_20220 [Theionarchaea archaeon DG-70-1]|nr:MAG: hypothetical protein AYK19_20220 [Theionarchaea archaeon DG-70-1]
MITVVACGILEAEVRKVVQKLEIPLNIVIMHPGLHVYPLKLKKELEDLLRTIKDQVVIVYGECFPGIDYTCEKYSAVRIQGENCYEIMAGDRFYQLLKEEPGTYFLLPQLCKRFEELTKEVLMKEMKGVFFRNYRRCVFLDTGIYNDKKCSRIAEELGLFYFREYVGTATLEERLRKALNAVKKSKNENKNES